MDYKKDILNIYKSELPWEKLSGSKILVTGATGLIGGCFVDVLMSNPSIDYTVYALGRNSERAQERFKKYEKNTKFCFIQYDIENPLDLNVSFDYIIHAASGAAPAEFVSHPVEVMKANINGVSNLIEYGIKHDMRRFLYISSGEVYGEGDGRVFSEDYSGYVNPCLSRSCYPSSKRAAETLCVSYADEYGVDVVIARPCHIYGPHFTENDNRVYAQFIRNVLNGEDIVMKSTGEQFRSWCYVVDCVLGLLYILLKGTCGQAYNIADSASNITIRQLAEMVASAKEKQVVVQIPDEDEKKGYNKVPKSVFSTAKLETLGWRVSGNMKDKLRRTIEECQKCTNLIDCPLD